MRLLYSLLTLAASVRADYVYHKFVDGECVTGTVGVVIRSINVDYGGGDGPADACVPAHVYFHSADDLALFNSETGSDFVTLEGNKVYMIRAGDDTELHSDATCQIDLATFHADTGVACADPDTISFFTSGEHVEANTVVEVGGEPVATVDMLTISYYSTICDDEEAPDAEAGVVITTQGIAPTFAGEPSVCVPATVTFSTMEDMHLFNAEFVDAYNYDSLTGNAIFVKWRFDEVEVEVIENDTYVTMRNYDVQFFADSNCEEIVTSKTAAETAYQSGTSLINFRNKHDVDPLNEVAFCDHLVTGFLYEDGSVVVHYEPVSVVVEADNVDSEGFHRCVATMHTASGCSAQSHAVTIHSAAGLDHSCIGASIEFADRESRLLFNEEFGADFKADGIVYTKFFHAEDDTIDMEFFWDQFCEDRFEDQFNIDEDTCVPEIDHGNTELQFYHVTCYDTTIDASGDYNEHPVYENPDDNGFLTEAEPEEADCHAHWYTDPNCDEDSKFAEIESEDQEDDVCIGLTTLSFESWRGLKLFNDAFNTAANGHLPYDSKDNNVVFMKQYRNVIDDRVYVDLHFFTDSECSEESEITDMENVINGACVPTDVKGVFYNTDCHQEDI